MDTGPFFRRSFRQVQAHDKDITYFILIEYQWTEDEDGFQTNTSSRYLTHNGWQAFQPWDQLNLSDVPQISGLDMVQQHSIEAALDKFTETIRELLKQEKAPANRTNPTRKVTANG